MAAEIEERLRAAAPQPSAARGWSSPTWSALGPGRSRPDSDVDVAVHLDPAGSPEDALAAALRLAARLEETSRIGGIEVVVLNEALLPLRRRRPGEGGRRRRVSDRARWRVGRSWGPTEARRTVERGTEDVPAGLGG